MTEPARNQLSRRTLLAGATAVAGGTLAAGTVGHAATEPAGLGPVRIRPGDPRYENLLRGNNFRFTGQPEEIRVVSSAEQVVRAVAEAARTGRRIAPRSGGHCFENFTADPQVRLLLDLSPMDEVGYDPAMKAFAVQPGATLGQVYRRLFQGWGVTIPGGSCPAVGAGGHFAGGGYGALSRRYGSVVDHLYGVEVVVADRDGTARAVVATREPEDPNRELWWAHTGGGGGNFGVVTRYWLRSPGATGEPSRLLPPSPRTMLERVVSWAWAGMTEQAFTRLLRNFGVWHERNSEPGARPAGLYAILLLSHHSAGYFSLAMQIDADLPGAEGLVAEFLAAVTEGTGVKPIDDRHQRMPWLHKMTWPGTGEAGDASARRYKNKAGYLRRSLTDRQLAAVHHHLAKTIATPSATMLLIGYGGQVQAVPPEATAIAQRGAVMKAVYSTTWTDERQDDTHLAWIRAFYRDVYLDTGGVPVPGEVSDGSYINYPDNDLADPGQNTSGVPAHTLYYGDNYPRLQRVKARWDPRGIFRHALGVEPPA
ncbi:FAD-binding oxidoreductase [Crossiella sp. CA-258035]|uniref:FAD-binding oxidoreductase n=1 Tax=Crossiella sp. CA-258035 TaxID=2981138 RepID=UPI0024BC96B8|nr:FAD-binding oxidoreductase [Crossiella sp. CA-258035]WHT15679.1 FAD-binding oxidoreductase [Crossiella sp. CA-258035]